MHIKSSQSIILTGATGFLGAFLLESLLKRGYSVAVLGRSTKDLTLSQRLSNLVEWFGISDPGKRLYGIEVDFAKKNLGLNHETYQWLCGTAYKIIHCASDTSFAERNREQVITTNVHNVQSLLNLAAEAKTEHFYYLSTAYAAGLCEGVCLEAPITTNEFTNVYEESKARAENIIWNFCEAKNVSLSILRPSIVYGHSKSGKALKFNALYHPVKALLYTRDIFINDIVRHNGKRCQQWEISLESNGKLNLPLSIYLLNHGSVNLISIDHFVETAMKIFEHSAAGGIYHLTSGKPTNMTTLAEYSARFLNVCGIKILYDKSGTVHALNPVEELFGKFIEQYRPYLSDQRIFDQSRIKKIIPDLAAPAFTYDIFERCMNYAVACDWKTKI